MITFVDTNVLINYRFHLLHYSMVTSLNKYCSTHQQKMGDPQYPIRYFQFFRVK
jgi:hypothetical protein